MTAAEPILTWLQDHGFQTPLTLEPNAAGQHALILAAQQGRHEVLDYLIKQSADIEAVDAYGNNALWASCYAESSECIAALLAAGVNIDRQNPAGATALIYASSSGKQAVVKQLLDAGANPLLTTQDDFSALDLAANRSCLKIMRDAVKAVSA